MTGTVCDFIRQIGFLSINVDVAISSSQVCGAVIGDEAAPKLFLVSPYMVNGTLPQWRKRGEPLVRGLKKKVRPPGADMVTLGGAALHGLLKRQLVSSVVDRDCI